MDNNMEFTQEQIEDLKEQLLDNWYDGMDEKALEIFYKDIQREYLDSIEDLNELIELFDDNGLLDKDKEDEEND